MPASDLETRLLNCMGISFSEDETTDAPIAKLRATQMPERLATKRLWCLDPVYIQIDKEDAVLQANEQLDLSEHESRQIIADLNSHFALDGIKLHYHSRHHWLLAAEFTLSTTSLSRVLLNPISQYQPVGPDEKLWRNLINEVQMLLYNHPVNEAREARGVMPANSVWLWGGGTTYQYKPRVDSVFCDTSWVNDIASSCHIPHYLGSLIETEVSQQSSSLLVYLDSLDGIKRNDAFAWLDSLCQFENQVLNSLFNLVVKKKLETLTIISDTVSILLTKKELNKWWRRKQPLRNSILMLRDRYGY